MIHNVKWQQKKRLSGRRWKSKNRYLCDTMKSFHKEFLRLHPNMKIGYSTFCRFKPFWIKSMALSNRDTCKCIICGNMEFLIDSLNRIGVLSQKSFSYCKSLYCCNSQNEYCLLQVYKVSKARSKQMLTICSLVKYYKWVKVKKRITKKNKSFLNLLRSFDRFWIIYGVIPETWGPEISSIWWNKGNERKSQRKWSSWSKWELLIEACGRNLTKYLLLDFVLFQNL